MSDCSKAKDADWYLNDLECATAALEEMIKRWKERGRG